uniref:Cytochrome c oxidase subunit 2 n=1 Tax=Darthula hardwickii TaxID=1264638 RepID=A0A0U1Z623_9HEMI|nr:cytochrome c oxidase subunit II [Darthula hardwickii]AJP09349.1 cytochrome c oxidase subunit II [Darthula hardwickii]
MYKWWKYSFQDAMTPTMEQMIMFHDHAMMIIIMITTMVGYLLMLMMKNKLVNHMLLENQMVEMIWTLSPTIMLVFIALPSLRILYLMEESMNPVITVKAIGHQWYWSYEYSDLKNIEFDSYMVKTKMLKMNEFRLFETDNRLIIPFKMNLRMLTSSMNVIHSWTIPSSGIKIDASPGRINQGSMFISRPGIFYGQCSEICGANHSFMPITMESINIKTFINWMKTM